MGSYVIDNDDPDELKRLRSIEAICDGGTFRRLSSLGVTSGWRCLEFGTGAGSVARWMAAQVGDPMLVVATDLEPQRVAALRAEGLDARVHDITREDLPPESFDLIHCRCVLHHLPSRYEVMRRLKRMLRPGGYVLLEEYDAFATQTGCNVEIGAMWRALMMAMEVAGAAPVWAHELPADLHAIGMQDIQATGEIEYYSPDSPAAEFCRLTWQQLAPLCVSKGWLTTETLEASLKYLSSPGAYFMLPALIAVSARRPVVE